jgi:Protein of unknown function (DUF4058)
MPVHDWKAVDANLFHHFHRRWTLEICDALNGGILPAGYSALVEQRAAGVEPDVLAFERRNRKTASDDSNGSVLTLAPPKTRHAVEFDEDVLAGKANRIVVRHRLGELVGVMEIVSPGNKNSRSALESFVKKSVPFLRNGVNLLVIDLFPPTPRDPGGIHQAISEEFGGDTFELPPDKPLTLAAYVACDVLVGRATKGFVEWVGVGDVLPDMPAYLDFRGHVPVPLEATYQRTWESCPADVRTLVETGRLPDDE